MMWMVQVDSELPITGGVQAELVNQFSGMLLRIPLDAPWLLPGLAYPDKE